ncbi:hypothetical protein SAMN05421821_105143 [Mucilaginibacter lappiensis]|uniref:Uncharacterized protein n=1 Tax=Mucilaginibacter lappiensis TaxID=354630 RepID=A0ABR6PN72_9SPHI|nr:hypothetical protein [Mucilaginibacter lappiensis]MBB6109726.1 hypothetical protein [Mucilaginibacter lappiensis]SIR13268.1 hypothetical protein SAMN05421821_105143 [Mucilaginibacter lappiensis]
MQTIQQILKNTAVNGVISIDKALEVANKFDQERTATAELLKKCEKNVGMYLGEEINAHVANMTGQHFSAVDYHYEKPVGEQ